MFFSFGTVNNATMDFRYLQALTVSHGQQLMSTCPKSPLRLHAGFLDICMMLDVLEVLLMLGKFKDCGFIEESIV